MGLLLLGGFGARSRVRAGEPATEPLEDRARFGLPAEGVERVRREPSAAEAETLVRDGPEALQDFDRTFRVLPILEQGFRGPHLNRGIRRKSFGRNLQQARGVLGMARLFVNLRLVE